MWPFFSVRDKQQTDAESFGDIARHTMRRGPAIVNMAVSVTALVFSAFSVFQTTLKQPDLAVFVPPEIQYAQPYNNSNFEVFAIPLTLANSGARTGTVLSLMLTVSNAKGETKSFYPANVGTWNMDKARAGELKPFAPIVLVGHGTQSETVLFYARREEKLQAVITETGTFHFKLTMQTAVAESYPLIDWLFRRHARPLEFDMVLPVMDHRAFVKGTLPMNAPNWQAVSGG